MFRLIALLLALATPNALVAQDLGCPVDVHAQVATLSDRAEGGEITLQTLGDRATELLRACTGNRAMMSQFLGMFTRVGLTIEPPSGDRFAAHLHALRTAGAIIRAGSGGFAPVALGDGAEWSGLDERNAYWDLMFAMSADFLVYGVHADLYTPGKTEQVGCGLYPDEEAAALAQHAEGNADGGELVSRIAFLGTRCDTVEHEVSGWVARYFAAHMQARVVDPDYASALTGGDIRSGLQRFLPLHLDGASESTLFSAREVEELLAF